MVIPLARHPVRLSPLSGSASRRCFLYGARHLPRAPLPVGGVTSFETVSSTASVGVTRPSSLIRAHAPDQVPPAELDCLSFDGSSQVATSPCWHLALPDVNPRIFPWVPGPLPRWTPAVRLPVSSHRRIGLPHVMTGSAFPRHSVQRLQYGAVFRGCSHSFTFGPSGLLATLVAPTT